MSLQSGQLLMLATRKASAHSAMGTKLIKYVATIFIGKKIIFFSVVARIFIDALSPLDKILNDLNEDQLMTTTKMHVSIKMMLTRATIGPE